MAITTFKSTRLKMEYYLQPTIMILSYILSSWAFLKFIRLFPRSFGLRLFLFIQWATSKSQTPLRGSKGERAKKLNREKPDV